VINETPNARTSFVAPIVQATVPRTMTFRERVFWYSVWIENFPMSHIDFTDEEDRHMFFSDRHVAL
jgi:hypothetical protein